MSSPLGRIVMNTRERGVSNDINRLQDLLGLDLMEMYRGLAGFHMNPNGTVSQDRNAVIRGLAAVPGGAGLSVDVQEGYATIIRSAGPPTADDSAYRLLHNRAAQNLVLAAADPVNPRFDLIEATFSDDLVESQNRDIYNPVTGLFAPAAVDKVRKAGCVLTVTTGAAGANPVIPAFSAAATDRIPIAAVRVPALAAAIVANDILDLRPLFVPAPMTKAHGIIDGFDLAATSTTAGFPGWTVRPGQAMVDGQLLRQVGSLILSTTGTIDPAAFPLTAATWYYAYLFACRDSAGHRARFTNIATPLQEGFIVLSSVPPTIEGYPSAPVGFPTAAGGGGVGDTLFSGDSSSRGLYLGALRTDVVATNIRPFFRTNDWYRHADAPDIAVSPGASPSTEIIDLTAAGVSPLTCRGVRCELGGVIVSNASQGTHSIEVRSPSGSTLALANVAFSPQASIAEVIHLGGIEVPLTATRMFDLRFAFVGFDRWDGALLQLNIRGLFDPRPRLK
jgi:hypothetical protein